MIANFRRAATVIALAMALASCQPPDRDIVVVWRNGQLAVDFPWTLWRLVGLQDRSYCIRRVKLFDPNRLLWTLEAKQDVSGYRSCLDVTMPLRVGRPLAGFVSNGRPVIRSGMRYGIAIMGIGDGRVDFTVTGNDSPKNVTDWKEQMEAPCGSCRGECPSSSAPTC